MTTEAMPQVTKDLRRFSEPPLGATKLKDGSVQFRVWAPEITAVQLRLHDQGLVVPMEKDDRGYYSANVSQMSHGERYTFILNGKTERPDPASHFQPEGADSDESGHPFRSIPDSIPLKPDNNRSEATLRVSD